MSRDRLDLVSAYAHKEAMTYEEALALLSEEAASYDNAQTFLDEIDMGSRYLYDARLLMDEAQ